MKKMICKITAVLTVLVLMLSVFAINTSALSGTTAITVSNSNPKVGSTLIVTASFSLDGEAAVNGQLKYDSSKLKYLSSSPANDTNHPTAGTVYMVADDLVKSHYFRVEFEVIAEGNASLSMVDCHASNQTEVEVPGTSKTVKTGNTQSTSSQDTTKNTGAALTSITVAAGTLTPAFKQDVTEYTVVVPYTQTDGILSCESKDQKAKITVEGSRELKVGLNKRIIVVTASNGEVRRYTVTFNRLDENGNDTTATTTEGIIATVNGKEFTVKQADATYTVPAGFTLTTTTYNEQEIAVYADQSGKVMIAYLVANDGSEEGFFLFENGEFKIFNFIEVNGKIYIVSEGDTAPDGFFKSEFVKEDKKLPCYKYMANDYADFVVFFATEVGGEEGYYRYDTLEGTIQRFPEFKEGAETQTNNDINIPSSKKITVFALSAVLLLGVIAVIVLVIIKIVVMAKNKKAETDNY